MSKDADATVEADRAWFAAHSAADRFRRELSWCESEMLRATLPPLPEGSQLAGHVVVRQLGPGVRVRDFANVLCVLPSQDAS